MRAGLIAPIYLSVSWILTVTYQLLTETAVKTIATNISVGWPSAASWINANVSVLVFIYAFTWIFVLSSVLPQVILGKQRSVLIQFVFVLALTLIAFYIVDIIQAIVGINVNHIVQASSFLTNPIFAGVYLAIPYLVMIGIDYRSKRCPSQDQ